MSRRVCRLHRLSHRDARPRLASRAVTAFAASALLMAELGCTQAAEPVSPEAQARRNAPANAQPIKMAAAKTFRVYTRDGYRIVDIKAPVVSWGGGAKGPDQTARVVLVPRTRTPPELRGDLSGAVVVRTPVKRIAVNYSYLEAILTALGVEEQLVAVGGVKSYNDAIRERARSGQIAQIGYGWHSPPALDPLVAAKPDVFFMVLGDLGHAEHYERIKGLGIPVVPVFLDREPTYMGAIDYVRLIGMFVGRSAKAEDYATTVENKVAELKKLVADRPKKKVLSAWFSGSGRWMVTVRNTENQLLEDAGGINVMAAADDIRLDSFVRIGSEQLLAHARDADCWIIRDTHSKPLNDVGFLKHFKAWRDGCLFASDGARKPEADAFDFYERGPIRPDILLSDLIRMLHPELIQAPPVYILADKKTPRP